jgi:hypothetical protein
MMKGMGTGMTIDEASAAVRRSASPNSLSIVLMLACPGR